MSRLSKLVMPSVLVGLLSCCVLANAEPPAPPKDAPAGVEVTGGAPLTDEALGQMLRGLGYEPEIVSSPSASHKIYRVRIKQDTWTVFFDVQLSPDQKVVWVTTYLGHIPADGKIQSEALLTILRLNATTLGKEKFVITPNGDLYIWKPVDNIGITPSRLRNELENLMVSVKETAASWKTGLWTAEGKQAKAFQQKVATLYGKTQDAGREFYQELKPILEGRPVDRDRLRKAHANLLRTIREVRAELKALEVPDSAAAREYLACYVQLLEADESFLANEMVDALRIAEDDTISPSDRAAKINPILQVLSKREEAPLKALQTATANFRKHYGDI